MNRHSRIPVTVSPLLWLAPLPFVLAMCLPLSLPRGAEPPVERVAVVAPSVSVAASALQVSPR